MRKMRLTAVIWLLLSACYSIGFSQTPVHDSLRKALLTEKLPQGKVNVLIALSEESESENPTESIRYGREAYKMASENDLEHESIRALIRMANSYIRVSNYQEAFVHADKARELAKQLGWSDLYAKSVGIIGLIYHEMGDYENSAKFDFEYLRYWEEKKDQKQIGIAYGNIGIDFISQGNYRKGLEYLEKSFQIAKTLNDYDGMAYQYNNIAGVYSEYYKDFTMALNYYKEALAINARIKDERQKGIYTMNIGNCFSRLNRNDSTLKYYSAALAIFRSIDNPLLIAECQTLMAEHFMKTGQLALGRQFADSALSISSKNDYLEQKKTSAALLHKILLKQHDTLSAYRFAMIENEVKDSLVNIQNRQEVYKLEFQYNYEKQDKLKQISRQRKETLMIVIILSLSSVVIILALLFSRNRIKSRNVALEKDAIEKELKFKNKELTINLISLIRKNELLAEISNKLVKIGSTAKQEETKDAINKISREVRLSADDKMLKEFSMRFQDVHAGFYDELLKRFPNLTQNELKICAFLRLNMSSKEISELTGQRILTIDHARYRLRKKLGISNVEVNLVTFLSQI